MNKGYVAITSVLIIAAIGIIIGTVITLSSISEGQTSLSGERREAALDLTESCVEDSLYSINTTNSLGSAITLPPGSCTVTVNSHVGANWTYTVTGTLNGYTKTVQITATRSNTITPIVWKEQ
jgi:hypothetical protein